MIIQAIHSSGYLDISSVSSDNIVGPQLRVALRPNQIVTISDNYRSVAAINTAINQGLLRVISYSTTDPSYAVVTTGQTIEDKTMKSYTESIIELGNVSGATTINLSLGNVFSACATGNVTWSFTNPPDSGKCFSFTLVLENGGAFTQTWPSPNSKWESALTPTLTASGYDILVFMTLDSGSSWYGILSGLDMQ